DTAREYLGLRGHTAGICDVSWRADGNLLASASDDGTVRLWEMNDGKQIKSINAHSGGALCVDLAADGRFVSGGKERLVKIWDGSGNAIDGNISKFDEAVLKVGFLADRVIAGDWTGQVRLLNIKDKKEVAQLPPNPPKLEMLVDQLNSKIQGAEQSLQK